MHRLFVALRPPAAVRDLLSDAMDGVPEARWQDDEQLHLTVRFIGDVGRMQAEDVAVALSQLSGSSIEARIAGVGGFGRRDAIHTLWADVAPREPLAALHARVDRALVTAGIDPDRRAFVPHVTLARLSRTAGRSPDAERWLAAHADLASAAFSFGRLILYESTLARDGARYDAVAAWPLA